MSEKINKVISSVYVWNDKFKCNTIVAEVIENPGMGFEWLIRIDPNYKKCLDIFLKCYKICGIDIEYLTTEIINNSFEKGYYTAHEEIALICDKIV